MAVTKLTSTHTIFGQSILTTVTKYPRVVKQWINDVNADGNNGHRYVGIEMELDYNASRVGTVQLCVGNRCLVFQLLRKSPCPPSLEQFLGNRNNTFVVTNDFEFKLTILRRQYPVESRMSFFNLGRNGPVLKTEKERLLAMVSLVETDWARPFNLSDRQVQYACLDVFLNLHVVRWLWNI